MDDLDDLVLIEEDDYMPSSPLLSRTASPAMRDGGRSSSVSERTVNKEVEKKHFHCCHSPEIESPSMPSPPAVTAFSPPPPPPSSESHASTPPIDEPLTSSIAPPADEPPSFTESVKEIADDSDICNNDPVAGLQETPEPRLSPPSKVCHYPVTVHDGKAHKHGRRRRCGFNDAAPLPPMLPLPPPPEFWHTHEDSDEEQGASEAPPPVPVFPDGLPPLPPMPRRKKGFQSLGPPPPPPPPFIDLPVPPPPPPPPRVPLAFSATDLIPRYWNPVPIERAVQLDPPNAMTMESRTGILLHHRASPFDLHHWLWLLKYGEPERWHARPAEAELARLRRFEAKGLSSDVADVIANVHSEAREPATRARTVKLWVGEVMTGVDEDALRRRLDDAFLVFYSIVEAPELRDDDDELDDGDGDEEDDDSRTRARRACDEALAGGEKVYKVERTGNVDACLARAWHNATINGWSTVFSCVVAGDVDLVQADRGMGVSGFERVSHLGQLEDSQGPSDKIKIFY